MKRIILLLAIVVVAVALAFLTLPEDPGQQSRITPQVKHPTQSEAELQRELEQAAVEAERDRRLAAMKVKYEKLERERRNLRQRLEEVAYYTARADLTDEQKQRIRDEINSANRLLVNPPMLGAFRGVEGIESELDRIDNINKQLDEFRALIETAGGYG